MLLIMNAIFSKNNFHNHHVNILPIFDKFKTMLFMINTMPFAKNDHCDTKSEALNHAFTLIYFTLVNLHISLKILKLLDIYEAR
jgi:hypothetical protein